MTLSCAVGHGGGLRKVSALREACPCGSAPWRNVHAVSDGRVGTASVRHVRAVSLLAGACAAGTPRSDPRRPRKERYGTRSPNGPDARAGKRRDRTDAGHLRDGADTGRSWHEPPHVDRGRLVLRLTLVLAADRLARNAIEAVARILARAADQQMLL